MTAMAAVARPHHAPQVRPERVHHPFRTPVLAAREIAMIDYLSGGRMLPAFGIAWSRSASSWPPGCRSRSVAAGPTRPIAIMRKVWAEDEVTFAGEFWKLERITVLPKPVQQPMPLWIGGNSEAAMRRAGRLGDGWIPSFITPEQFRIAWRNPGLGRRIGTGSKPSPAARPAAWPPRCCRRSTAAIGCCTGLGRTVMRSSFQNSPAKVTSSSATTLRMIADGLVGPAATLLERHPGGQELALLLHADAEGRQHAPARQVIDHGDLYARPAPVCGTGG